MKKIMCVVATAIMNAPMFASAEDLSVGYYYPEITSQESFGCVLDLEFETSAELRSRFVTTLTKSRFESPANPNYVVFSKGTNSQKLIIVALDDRVFNNSIAPAQYWRN